MSETIEKIEERLENMKAQAKLDKITTEFQEAVEQINSRTAKAITDWIKENETKIPEAVIVLLNKTAHEIFAAMLGLTYRFGRWEVDGNNATVAKFIREQTEAPVKAWVAEKFGAMPKLTKAQEAAVEAKYKEIIMERLMDSVRDIADDHANTILDKVVLPYKIKDVGYGDGRKIDLKL